MVDDNIMFNDTEEFIKNLKKENYELKFQLDVVRERIAIQSLEYEEEIKRLKEIIDNIKTLLGV